MVLWIIHLPSSLLLIELSIIGCLLNCSILMLLSFATSRFSAWLFCGFFILVYLHYHESCGWLWVGKGCENSFSEVSEALHNNLFILDKINIIYKKFLEYRCLKYAPKSLTLGFSKELRPSVKRRYALSFFFNRSLKLLLFDLVCFNLSSACFNFFMNFEFILKQFD